MKGLDNNDIFKHGASAKKQVQQKPYINTYINVSKYNSQTRQMDNQGRFILAVTRTTQSTNITVYKSGAHNLFSFSLSRNINWTLQNQVYVYITDPKGVQWLFQFQNANEAAQATAAIGILMSVKKSTECATFDTNVVKASRGLQIGDSATLIFHCFSISQFPFVACPPTSAELNYSTQIARDKLPVGFVTGVLGMTVGSTRAIYIPSSLTSLENGQRDNRFPASNLMVVVTLKSVGSEEPAPQQLSVQSSEAQINPQQSDTIDSTPTSARKPVATAPSDESVPTTVVKEEQEDTQPTNDENSEKIDDAEVEDQADREEYERMQKIKKIQKMGGVSSFNMQPNPMSSGLGTTEKRRRSFASEPSTDTYTPPSTTPKRYDDDEYMMYSGGLNEIQKSIMSKLDLLTGGTNDVMRSVSCLSIQLQEKINKINQMKQEMEEYRTKAANSVSFKELETVKREADQVKKDNKILENRLTELETRYARLRQRATDNAEASKQREKSIIKKLMGDAFSEISNIFDGDSDYKGAEVSEQLYSILRKNAFSAMDEINKNGLF